MDKLLSRLTAIAIVHGVVLITVGGGASTAILTSASIFVASTLLSGGQGRDAAQRP